MNKLLDIFNKEVLKNNEILFWWLGGASFFLRSNSKRIIIDPYLTNSVYTVLKPFFNSPKKKLYRLEESLLKPNEINCDYYICTHDHLDHLDPETVSKNKKSHIKFIGPESCAKHFKRLGIPAQNIIQLGRKKTLNLNNDITITAVNAKHSGPLDIDMSLKLGKEVYGKDDGQGYILKINSVLIYHTSDTEFLEDFIRLREFDIDIILLAANGKAGNMTPQEGAKLVEIIEPEIVIPMHYGIIPFTDFDPEVFKTIFRRTKIDSELKILNVGDFFKYKKGK